MALADIDERPRYTVTTEAFRDENGGPAVIYSGPNRETAVRKANFWDERANTYFTEDVPPRDALGRALWRFDKLIDQLDSGTLLS